ncbi:MAG: DUF192 domain-containing protein [Bryobacteraceae bacterium]
MGFFRVRLIRLGAALSVFWVCVILSACGSKSTSVEDFNSRPVTLPDGKVIEAEVMVHEQDMIRGMMFRDSLAPDRGMLFIHGQEGKFPYRLYQVRVPLDILWMNSNRRIVEISADSKPCPLQSAKACPLYGGHEDALFVLELAAGVAAKNGLQVGDTLTFY